MVKQSIGPKETLVRAMREQQANAPPAPKKKDPGAEPLWKTQLKASRAGKTRRERGQKAK